LHLSIGQAQPIWKSPTWPEADMAHSLHRLLDHVRNLVRYPFQVDQPDDYLLERFRTTRDEAAFADLLERHAALVHGVCRRVLGNSSEADDAFQVTFLTLAVKAGTMRRGQALAAWLYRVAYLVSVRALQRAVRRRSQEAHAMPAPCPDPEAALAWRELGPVLDRELNCLPEKYRAPLVLCGIQGKTSEQAARELRWPIGSMSRRLARGRELLRQRLVRLGFPVPAVLPALLWSEEAAAARPPLAEVTVQQAALLAGGRTVPSAVLGMDVAALLEDTLRATSMSKLRIAAMCAIVLATVGTALGIGLARRAEPAAGPPPIAALRADQPGSPPRLDRYGDALPDGALKRFGSDRFRPALDSERCIAFSSDLRMVAWTDHANRIFVGDVNSGKQLRQWAGNRHSRHSGPLLAMSADGQLVASAEKADTVVVWDVATGKELSTIRLGPSAFGISDFAMAPDGRSLATAITDQEDRTTIYICELPSGKERARIAAVQGFLGTLRFSPDGKRLLSWGHGNSFSEDAWDKTYPIALWSAATGKELYQLDCGKGVTHAAFAPDSGTLFWTELQAKRGEPGATHVVDVTTGKERTRPMRGPNGPLALSPDGKTLASRTADGEGLGQWDTTTGKLRSKIKAWNSVVAFAADGKTLAAAGLGELRTWDPATGEERVNHRFWGHDLPVLRLAFAPDGNTLFSSNYGGREGFGELIIWDVDTAHDRFTRILGDGNERASLLGVSADGRLIVFEDPNRGGGSPVRFLEPERGQEVQSLVVPGESGAQVAVSPDGRFLASWGDSLKGDERHTVQLIDVVTQKKVGEIPFVRPRGFGYSVASNFLAFSPDGKLLAIATGQANARDGGCFNQVQLCDVATGKKLGRIGNPQDDRDITVITFTPDGRNLLTRQGDKVRMWEVATNQVRREIPGGPFALSRDGRYLATLVGEWDPVAIVCDLRSGCECQQFKTQRGLQALAFAPNGKALAAGGAETTILLWELNRSAQPMAAPELNSKAAEALWADLASTDASRAYQAVAALAAAPRSGVAILGANLRPVPPPSAAVRKLVAELNDEQFKVRNRALLELEKLGDPAEVAVRDALKNDHQSLEARRRLEQLLEKLERQDLSPAMARSVRAIETLELIGSAEARNLLEALARDGADSRQTREAKAAFDRLAGSR
jgi:RNA polymerase sigma factor (sigma-70 family)